MKKYIGFLVSFLLALTMSAQSHVVLADSLQDDSISHRPHKVQRQGFSPSSLMGRYTPQSPQTAALLKYTEFPVSPATGIPNIEIPIYTIEMDGVSVPISISYHASGIKVSDVASPVGLGWTLNAGGVIGCSTNGVRDDYANQTIKSASEFKEKLASGILSPTALRYIASGTGSIDTESDRYQYAFNGHNGCLRYDYTDMSLRTIPYEPVMFETLASGGFKAIDGNGTQYFFTLTEFVSMTGYSHRSACYLTSIVTPTQSDTIRFVYGKTSVYTQTLASEYQHSGTYYDWDEENVGSGIPYMPVEGPVSEYTINKNNVNYATPLITSISWNGNSVVFSYSSDRPEYKLQRERLTQIQIKDYMDHAVSTVSLDNSASLGGADREKRMLLRGITMTGTGSASNPIKYSFGYNMEPLPEYMDINDLSTIRFHEDYWGYYNGTTSVHSVPREYTASPSIGGTDRTPDAKYAQHGILTSITYPTGGTSSFSYEENVAHGVCGGLRIREISHAYQGKLLGREVFSYPEGSTYLDVSEDLYRYTTRYYYYRDFHLHSYGTEWDTSDHVVSQGCPILSLTGWSSTPVFYDNVTRSYYDSTGKQCGKTESHYIDAKQGNNRCSGVDNYDYPRFYSELYNCDTGFPQPLQTNESHYQYVDGKPCLVSNHSYSYKEIRMDDFPIGVRVSKDDVEVVYYTNKSDNSYVPYPSWSAFNDSFQYHDVYAIPTFYILQGKSSINYETGEMSSEAYQYDRDYRSFKPTTVTTTCSDGKNRTVSYTYPFNATGLLGTTTSTVRQMLSRNQYDFVLAEKEQKASLTVSQTENGYVFSGNKLYKTAVFHSLGGNKLEKRLEFGNFDAGGNPRSMVQDSTLHQVLVWGYRHQYPVMQIAGIPYTAFSLLKTSISSIGSNNSPSTSDVNLVRQAATALGGLCSTYMYQPLVGMTSEKLPSGKTTSYSYDALGRLSGIKDTDGKTTHSYFYYYNNGNISTHSYVQGLEFLDAASQKRITKTNYYDGLGRELSTATTGRSPGGKVVQDYTEYDGMHRVSRAWLPAVVGAANGNVNMESLRPQVASTYSDSYPYTAYVHGGNSYTLTTTGPGSPWHTGGHSQKRNTRLNSASTVKLYMTTVGSESVSQSGYYAAGTLFETTMTDEDGKVSSTFFDRDGRKVLERKSGADGNLDTYFVYDDLGLLRHVLTPQYQQETSLPKYAYSYQYDHRGRLTRKKLPGCEYVQYWYDKADRMVYEQTAILRKKGIYRFYVYDRLGRIVMQGTCSSCNRSGMSLVATYYTNESGFCDSGYKLTNTDGIVGAGLEQVNYYDNYNFLENGATKSAFAKVFLTSSTSAVGYLTGRQTLTSSGKKLCSTYLYDNKGQLLSTKSTTLDDKVETKELGYTFTGKQSSANYRCWEADENTLILQASGETSYNTYNDMPYERRLELTSKSSSNTATSGSVTIASNTYDDLGRLTSVKRGNGTTVSYAYNARSWPTAITSASFSEQLHYTDGVGAACYNGNISSMLWSSSGYANLRGYKFTYDGYNRLGEAVYGEQDGLGVNKNRFNETISQYDANGNIKRLARNGKRQDGSYGKIDDLTLSYSGNCLTKVVDTASPIYYSGSTDFKDDDNSQDVEYGYDGMGAMTYDRNRGIALVEYDDWGNPLRIQFTNGNTTEYVYDANGTKLRVVHTTAVPNVKVAIGCKHVLTAVEILGTDRTDNLDDGKLVLHNGKPTMFLFEGGYCSISASNSIDFHYYNADHLGNVREVVGNNGAVEQVTHYYPFGNIFCDGSSTNYDVQPYKYNGKELDLIHGLNSYDYGARQLTMGIPRWGRVDPLAENTPAESPYAYCGNNPINKVDYDGCLYGDYYGKNGLWLGSDGKNDNIAYVSSGVKIINGSKSFLDAQKLDIANTDLNIFANTVAQESSGSKNESYALASSIVNLAKYRGKNIIKTIRTEGIFGYRDGGNTTKYNNNNKYGMAAAINSLTGGYDFSAGAIRWDGFDLAAKGYEHIKPQRAGIMISMSLFLAFKKAWSNKDISNFSGGRYHMFSSNFSSGVHPAVVGPNKGLVLYKASAVWGKTIFWKINPVKGFGGYY